MLLVDNLLAALFILTIRNFKVTESLQCFSCQGQNDICDGNYCTTVRNGYCAFQQQLDAYGKVLHVLQACLTQNFIRAGDTLITQVGQCLTTEDPKSGTRYRTYICNNTDFCNLDCIENSASSLTTVATTKIASPSHILKCYSCDQIAENCFNEQCSTVHNGYCLFQRQQHNVNGAVQYRSIKRCISAPYALTPSGNVITTTNQCILSSDANGNRYYTLLCNTTDFCNQECIPAISTTATILQTTTTSSTTSDAKAFGALLLVTIRCVLKTI